MIGLHRRWEKIGRVGSDLDFVVLVVLVMLEYPLRVSLVPNMAGICHGHKLRMVDWTCQSLWLHVTKVA